MKNIGILTGGGDSAGINATLWSIQTRSQQRGWQVSGIRNGWGGLLEGDVRPLPEDLYRFWDQPGTLLGTSRVNPLANSNNGVSKIIEIMEEHSITDLIAIGGDDTLSVAAELSKAGFPVVGIPQSIDNDIAGTEYSLGFSTACGQISTSISSMLQSNVSHKRGMLVEVMGRDSGWLALYAAAACYAQALLIPEVPYDLDRFGQELVELTKDNPSPLVIVSEGISQSHLKLSLKEVDAFGNPRLEGGVYQLGSYLKEEWNLNFRIQILGFQQRGGITDYQDKIYAARFAEKALELIEANKTGYLVGIRNNKATPVPLQDGIGKKRLVEPAHLQLVSGIIGIE